MRIAAFEEGDAGRWDTLVAAAPMATFLHTRQFLSYHGNRFVDRSLMIFDEKDRLVGVLPAAIDPNDSACVVSHPGATYGGIVHAGRLVGEDMITALAALCGHYRNAGFSRFLYKAIPSIYHKAPADDDLYALFRVGAGRIRCDLSAAVALDKRGRVSERRKRGARKAAAAGVQILEGSNLLSRYWRVLEENLQDKHGAGPVHRLDEIELLAARFPTGVSCSCALLDDEVVAGVVLFETENVSHAQYIATMPTGRSIGALDMLFESLIQGARDKGKRFFDFGISNEDQGRILNSGLFGFKSEFGASGIVHEFYEIGLT